MAEKFIVKLTAEERHMLNQLTATGKTAAATLRHARILLEADAAADDGAWSDQRIADALDASLSTIARGGGESRLAIHQRRCGNQAEATLPVNSARLIH